LIDEGGNTLPTFWKGGRAYVLGTQGSRYSLRIHNQSGTRVELVASVDGRDVLDGQPSSFSKRGYVVDPHSEVLIDGFRVSHEAVAAFRFSSLPRSYAARMGGDTRDVGVIGVAVFPERDEQPIAAPAEPHFWDHLWDNDKAAAADPPTPDNAGLEPLADNNLSAPHEITKQSSGIGFASLKKVPQGTKDSMSNQRQIAPVADRAADEAPAVPESAPSAPPPAATATAKLMNTNKLNAAISNGAGYRASGLMGRGSVSSMGVTASAPQPVERPGLGTEFGEHRQSHAEDREFERQSSAPATVISVHYNDREGLQILGIDVDGRLALAREARLRHDAQPFRRNSTPTYSRSPDILAK